MARFVTGARRPGDPDRGLTPNEAAQVADALANSVLVVPREQLPPNARGSLRTTGEKPDAFAQLRISDAITDGKFFNSPDEFAAAMIENLGLRGTFFHELGHLIDLRTGMTNPILQNIGARAGVKLPLNNLGLTDKVVAGMQALSQRNRPWLWDDEAMVERWRAQARAAGFELDPFREQGMRFEQNQYRNSFRELTADAIALYLRDPATAKRLAPETTAWIRNLANNNPKTNPIVQFMTFAGISAVGLSSRDSEGRSLLDRALERAAVTAAK